MCNIANYLGCSGTCQHSFLKFRGSWSSFICKKKKKRHESKTSVCQYSVNTFYTDKKPSSFPDAESTSSRLYFFNTFLIQRHVSFFKNDICSLKHIRWHMMYMLLEQYLTVFCLSWLHCFLITTYSSGIEHCFFWIAIKRASSKNFSVVKMKLEYTSNELYAESPEFQETLYDNYTKI